MLKRGIMIFGPAGSGKTTLGRMVAQQLDFLFVDIDDYIWRKDTEIPFSLLYSRTERISNLMDAISQTDHFVMAGSMDSFHEHFDPFFALAVYLTAPTKVRIARVHEREYEEFEHRRFLADVAAYDTGGGSTSFVVHNEWAKSLRCPVLRLNGSEDISSNLSAVVTKYTEVCTF